LRLCGELVHPLEADPYQPGDVPKRQMLLYQSTSGLPHQLPGSPLGQLGGLHGRLGCRQQFVDVGRDLESECHPHVVGVDVEHCRDQVAGHVLYLVESPGLGDADVLYFDHPPGTFSVDAGPILAHCCNHPFGAQAICFWMLPTTPAVISL
jgi:hypothetical protein